MTLFCWLFWINPIIISCPVRLVIVVKRQILICNAGFIIIHYKTSQIDLVKHFYARIIIAKDAETLPSKSNYRKRKTMSLCWLHWSDDQKSQFCGSKYDEEKEVKKQKWKNNVLTCWRKQCQWTNKSKLTYFF